MSAYMVVAVVVTALVTDWCVWLMLRPPRITFSAPKVVAEIPDMTFDWRGLV